MSETTDQHPRLTSHHVRGYVIDEEWYRDETGTLRCDCRVLDPLGRMIYRHSKLNDAMALLEAHLESERTKA